VGKGAGVEHAMKGGLGVALASDGDAAVGAVAVVNAFGDVRDGEGRILAGARAADGRFLDSAALVAGGRGRERFADAAAMRNTTLAVVATSAPLSRLELAQVAKAATAALYRRITPAGTTFDGDVVFAVAALDSGDATDGSPGSRTAADLMRFEQLAVRALDDAIERAVRLARGRDGIPGLADSAAS
jgi:L-aminopeptidase/D-esterase-like protein